MFAALNSFQTGGGIPVNISEVFSTTLYTGNSSTQTITNGIDLSTKGGLVWIKSRTYGVNGDHILTDTTRGRLSIIRSNLTNAATTASDTYNINSFNTTGFTLGDSWMGYTNSSGSNNVSWTFRKQPKFFDVVTYTGTGSNRTIAHSLGSVPGSIIIKRTDTTADWAVYHRSLANTQYLVLNTTAAAATGATWWNSTTPTSAVFSLGTDASVNASGGTYVAYIYAHDAGGFGLTGTDNVISCGSYTGNGSATGPVVTLGYQPQWLLTKRATGGTDNWSIFDSVRGIPTGGGDPRLAPNTSDAEVSTDVVDVSPTGFQIVSSASFMNNSGDTYIYIAINAS